MAGTPASSVVAAGGATEVGYDQVTATVTVTSATEATGTTVIACAAHTFDGNPVIATFFCPAVAPAALAANDILVSLFEGATQIGRLGYVLDGAAGGMTVSITGVLRFTPTAAAHTYTVTACRLGGTNGSLTCGSGGTGGWPPMFIRFTTAA